MDSHIALRRDVGTWRLTKHMQDRSQGRGSTRYYPIHSFRAQLYASLHGCATANAQPDLSRLDGIARQPIHIARRDNLARQPLHIHLGRPARAVYRGCRTHSRILCGGSVEHPGGIPGQFRSARVHGRDACRHLRLAGISDASARALPPRATGQLTRSTHPMAKPRTRWQATRVTRRELLYQPSAAHVGRPHRPSPPVGDGGDLEPALRIARLAVPQGAPTRLAAQHGWLCRLTRSPSNTPARCHRLEALRPRWSGRAQRWQWRPRRQPFFASGCGDHGDGEHRPGAVRCLDAEPVRPGCQHQKAPSAPVRGGSRVRWASRPALL